MKYFIIVGALLFGAYTFHTFNATTSVKEQTVNAVLGDLSFQNAYDRAPSVEDSEDQRLRTHLRYVIDQLMTSSTDHLSLQQVEKRNHAIALLDTYIQTGIFPSNYDYKGERKPCFRDKFNRICAVGYLLQQTGNENTVQKIQNENNYAYVEELAKIYPELGHWAAEYGLSVRECAMIQPTYGGPTITDNPDYVPVNHSILTAGFTGLGTATSTMGLLQLRNGTPGYVAPSIGIACGIGQVITGAHYLNQSYQSPEPWWGYPNVYKRNQNMAMLNIGVGVFSTALNTYILAQAFKKNYQPKKLTFQLYSAPQYNGEMAYGFHMVKNL